MPKEKENQNRKKNMKKILVLASIMVFTVGAAASDFSWQANIGSGYVTVENAFGEYNGMVFNAGGSGFYRLWGPHKVGVNFTTQYLSVSAKVYGDILTITPDTATVITYNGTKHTQSALELVFTPAYRLELQPKVYLQAALQIEIGAIYSTKFTERHTEYFSYDPGYIVELSARYIYVGAAYSYILSDDYAILHILRGYGFIPITDKLELVPSIHHRFGNRFNSYWQWNRTDFMIEAAYLF